MAEKHDTTTFTDIAERDGHTEVAPKPQSPALAKANAARREAANAKAAAKASTVKTPYTTLTNADGVTVFSFPGGYTTSSEETRDAYAARHYPDA